MLTYSYIHIYIREILYSCLQLANFAYCSFFGKKKITSTKSTTPFSPLIPNVHSISAVGYKKQQLLLLTVNGILCIYNVYLPSRKAAF